MSNIRRTRVEDYLSAIEQICEEGDLDRASTGSIATLLAVSNGTASSMLKRLAEDELVDHKAYEGASLTDRGRQRARRVLRRRRLIELFLSRTLNVAWESVADEAWRLEPAASEHFIERIDASLGHPQFDSHGDPIPRVDGTLPGGDAITLSACPRGAKVVLRRVKNQSETVLRFLRDAGLSLGVELSVLENSTVNGVVECESESGAKTLGYLVADQLLVREISER